MNQADYAEAALKMRTYTNRAKVATGEDAKAKRDDLIGELALEGHTASEIETMIDPAT